MRSNSQRSDRANALGWAHLCLAYANRAASEELAANGIRTTVIVDADIVISRAKPSPQNSLFRDLTVTEGREESPALLAGMSAYFFDWLFENADAKPRPGRYPWLIAPEHYREVVNKAKVEFDELDETNAQMQNVSKQALGVGADPVRYEQLTDLLSRLQQDPWARIDEDLAGLLGLLGVDGHDRPPHMVVEMLVQWLRQYGAHVIGTGRRVSSASPSLRWPEFVQSRERALIRVWREVLIPYRTVESSAGAIDTDARVLAAMTLINENWRENKHRVVLLTGSQSVLRAVCDLGLDPMKVRLSQGIQPAGDAMCDFVLLPSLVLASPELSSTGAVRSRGDLPSESELLLGEQEWSVSERRSLFDLIARRPFGRKSGREAGREIGNVTWPARSDTAFDADAAPIHHTVPEHFHDLVRYRFSDYFRENVKTSMAMEHVLKQLYDRRLQRIGVAKDQVQQATSLNLLVTQLRQLSEVREVRMRIELLELLIAVGTSRTHPSTADQHTNRLRAAPFVDWGNHPSADNLSEALANLDDTISASALDERLAGLKVAVYKDDPTTYLLVLVFARHYARQGRWELASSAAQFAFRLSQTSAYDKQRPTDIHGEEAVFLDLACQRRGAQTIDDIDRALLALRDHLAHIRASNPRLAAARFGVERISMGLTRLLFFFFQNGELGESLRLQANELLHEAVMQLDELQVTEPTTEALLSGAPADVHDRLTVNVCNLAWLTVGWSPLELGRSRVVGSKRVAFAKHQDEATRECVDASLQMLKRNCEHPALSQRQGSAFDWLSQVLCALHLAPDLLNWRDEGARAQVLQRLKHLQAQEVDHPYDAKRLAYALDLASKLRIS